MRCTHDVSNTHDYDVLDARLFNVLSCILRANDKLQNDMCEFRHTRERPLFGLQYRSLLISYVKTDKCNQNQWGQTSPNPPPPFARCFFFYFPRGRRRVLLDEQVYVQTIIMLPSRPGHPRHPRYDIVYIYIYICRR